MTKIGARRLQWLLSVAVQLRGQVPTETLPTVSGVLCILAVYMKAMLNTYVTSPSASSVGSSADPFRRSGLRQLPFDAPALDLTGKITKLDDRYSNAGGFSDVYKARYTSIDSVKEVRAFCYTSR